MGWNTEYVRASPMFEPLRFHGAVVFETAWPGPDDFQRLLDRRDPPVRVASGLPLQIVRQGRKPATLEEKYEARIYLRGELQVRRDHWHDTFNVLVWLAFPQAKAALNARHYAALREQLAARTANRGPAQDALTLFDEGGVIVTSCDDELLGLLREWRWKELFWGNRARVSAGMRFHLFGHALYEKALRPFIGVTGRGILLKVAPELLAAPPAAQLAALDSSVAEHILDPRHLIATSELAVIPILGVPGWCADNEREAYYDNTDYFRPGRR